MAFLKEDFAFTHIIAIDFGTGASGYIILYIYFSNLVMALPQRFLNLVKSLE
jgi:hypothetical protein